MKLSLALVFVGLGSGALLSLSANDDRHTIVGRMVHLGDDATPDWTEAPEQPEGQRFDTSFEGRAFDGEGTLSVTQRHVSNTWFVEINGARVATLDKDDGLGEHFYTLPAGVIVDGANTFALVPEQPSDDITVGNVWYAAGSLRETLGLRDVSISVTDADSGAPSPARITIVDADGDYVRLFDAERETAAVRSGVVYTSNGRADVALEPGTYDVYALRGTEWSLAHARLTVGGSNEVASAPLALELRREVDTRGFVAADTHIHTVTHSGHGDASVEERMITLAGEGVELAIATDHNHNTDYRPAQAALGLNELFTTVVGNEVTTKIGHLNAFPLDPNDEVPAHDGTDVVKIVEGIRAKGAKVVILNHPRWPSHADSPHGALQLDPYTGDWRGSWACAYDAVELINSDTEEPQPMLLFRDWFALLNRGEDVRAVAASDSHAVGVVVGQGRTYVRSSTDVPAEIDVDECATNIAAGRSSLSLGIFADMRRAGRSIMGDTLGADALAGGIELRVASPSWVTPLRATLYANGVAVQEIEFAEGPVAGGTDRTVALDPNAAWPAHDFWLVAIATGTEPGAPWWPNRNDYTLGATNPVFVDVDGDGVCSSPRAIARALVDEQGTDRDAVAAMLARVDSAAAVQVMRLVRRAYVREASERAALLGNATSGGDPWVGAWFESLEEPR